LAQPRLAVEADFAPARGRVREQEPGGRARLAGVDIRYRSRLRKRGGYIRARNPRGFDAHDAGGASDPGPERLETGEQNLHVPRAGVPAKFRDPLAQAGESGAPASESDEAIRLVSPADAWWIGSLAFVAQVRAPAGDAVRDV